MGEKLASLRKAKGLTQPEVAEKLGKTQRDLGPHRDQLIRKGLIYAPERGQIAFTVPGMDTYIWRLGRSLDESAALIRTVRERGDAGIGLA